MIGVGSANGAVDKRVQCEKCGAETTMPENATSGLCPFCGTNVVFAGKSSHLIRPEGLLPFTAKEAYLYRRDASGNKQEIPIELYKAVAEVLAYVYRIRKRT